VKKKVKKMSDYGDDHLEESDLDFQNLDEAFEMLYEMDVNSSDYSALQGRIFSTLPKDARVGQKDAYQVARHLSKGEIEKAEELTEELLEPEDL